jgi:peptide/nickel transport system permease protein
MLDSENDTNVIVPPRRFMEAWQMFAANKAALLGLGLGIIITITTVFGPLIYPIDPFEMVAAPMSPPGEDLLLGADYLGRDVLAGIIHGARTTVLVGFAATLFTLSIGVLIGVLAGFYGGWVESLLMRVTEFFQVLPALLLAMVLVALFSPSLATIIFAIGVVSWTPVARLTRGEFLKIKDAPEPKIQIGVDVKYCPDCDGVISYSDDRPFCRHCQGRIRESAKSFKSFRPIYLRH